MGMSRPSRFLAACRCRSCMTIQRRFSDCGFVKDWAVLSVGGHGSLRGRAFARLMMAFGGGQSQMSRAGSFCPNHLCGINPASVPSGRLSPTSPWPGIKFCSGVSLLCPFEFSSVFPKCQHQNADLAGSCYGSFFEAFSPGKPNGPGFQGRKPLHPANQGCGGLI